MADMRLSKGRGINSREGSTPSSRIEIYSMMGHREKLKSGDEHDLVFKWPAVYLTRPGERRRIKRMMNRRIRHGVKRQLENTHDCR